MGMRAELPECQGSLKFTASPQVHTGSDVCVLEMGVLEQV